MEYRGNASIRVLLRAFYSYQKIKFQACLSRQCWLINAREIIQRMEEREKESVCVNENVKRVVRYET